MISVAFNSAYGTGFTRLFEARQNTIATIKKYSTSKSTSIVVQWTTLVNSDNERDSCRLLNSSLIAFISANFLEEQVAFRHVRLSILRQLIIHYYNKKCPYLAYSMATETAVINTCAKSVVCGKYS